MSFKTDAFVLKTRPWREADRLYYLFTPHEGMIKAVLKSAAKPINKLSGHLLPFSKVRIMIGRGKIDHMAGAAVIQDYANIRTDLKNMSLAASVIELFLNQEGSGYSVLEFQLLEDLLAALDNSEIDQENKMLMVRIFLWKYLSLSGWQPQLDNCQICDKKISFGKYLPGRGIICREHNSNQGVAISSELIDFLKYIIKVDWPDLDSLTISKELNREWLKISQLFYQSVYERPSQALKLFLYG
jgi:DNA repair protein RecO (recombination protein O)